VAKLTGKAKAAFLRRMAAGRKKTKRPRSSKAPRKNAGASFRKLKKKLKKAGRTSAQLSRLKKDIRRASRALRSNPPKMKRLSKSTSWIRATAVKIVKSRGKPDQVLIRKAPAKRRR
jgi:hypothetical protein